MIVLPQPAAAANAAAAASGRGVMVVRIRFVVLAVGPQKDAKSDDDVIAPPGGCTLDERWLVERQPGIASSYLGGQAATVVAGVIIAMTYIGRRWYVPCYGSRRRRGGEGRSGGQAWAAAHGHR